MTKRPRIEILKEYRSALLRIYSPQSYFSRIRGFLKWYKGFPRPGDSAGSIFSMFMSFADLNLRYLLRPKLWFEYLRTMGAGLRHSAIGFARAAMMSPRRSAHTSGRRADRSRRRCSGRAARA